MPNLTGLSLNGLATFAVNLLGYSITKLTGDRRFWQAVVVGDGLILFLIGVAIVNRHVFKLSFRLGWKIQKTEAWPIIAVIRLEDAVQKAFDKFGETEAFSILTKLSDPGSNRASVAAFMVNDATVFARRPPSKTHVPVQYGQYGYIGDDANTLRNVGNGITFDDVLIPVKVFRDFKKKVRAMRLDPRVR